MALALGLQQAIAGHEIWGLLAARVMATGALGKGAQLRS
jgi:hypothetical protein